MYSFNRFLDRRCDIDSKRQGSTLWLKTRDIHENLRCIDPGVIFDGFSYKWTGKPPTHKR